MNLRVMDGSQRVLNSGSLVVVAFSFTLACAGRAMILKTSIELAKESQGTQRDEVKGLCSFILQGSYQGCEGST